jgi:hypothetical protein
MTEEGCAVDASEKIEHDRQGGCLSGKSLDAGRCWMNSLKQRIKGKAMISQTRGLETVMIEGQVVPVEPKGKRVVAVIVDEPQK